MKSFITHKNEAVTGERLSNAIDKVYSDMINYAYAKRKQNLYASHITEQMKDDILQKDLQRAEDAKSGKYWMAFWYNNKLDYAITGESIAILP